MNTEKVCIELSGSELNQIDMLVGQGLYPERSDFIRTAIRNQLEYYSDDKSLNSQFSQLTQELSQLKQETLTMTTAGNLKLAGIVKLRRKDLEKIRTSKLKVNIKMSGMLIIDNDVSPELAKETIKSVKVYGIIRASDEVKKVISDE